MSRASSRARREDQLTPRPQRSGLRPRRRKKRRTLGRPRPSPRVARPTSRGSLAGEASQGRLEGSASRGSSARKHRPPSTTAAAKEKRGPSSGRGGWGLPGAARDCLHPGRSSSPSLSTHLQAVRPRSKRSPPQARGHAPSQVVGVHHHVQLSGSAQVRDHNRSPPNALFPNHQQRASHQDPHRWRRRA